MHLSLLPHESSLLGESAPIPLDQSADLSGRLLYKQTYHYDTSPIEQLRIFLIEMKVICLAKYRQFFLKTGIINDNGKKIW